MGTATILSHLGGGKYRVKLLFDNALVELKLTSIDSRLTEINADLATLATDKAAKKAEYDQANSDLQDYINSTPTEDIVTDPSELNRLTADVYEKMGEYQVIVKKERELNLRKTALEKDKEYLTKYCPSEIETDIWCVHLVEDLTGTTKTIEVDYALERDPVTNQIKFDTGVWLPYEVQTPDSKMQHPMASSQHAIWYNLCALPAAQKDAPRYRVATLTDAANGVIEFDGQFNTDNDISRINNKTPIYPVIDEIQYQIYVGAELYRPCSMTDLYLDGDRVIVDCNGGIGTPTVLGFYSDPRECVPDYVAELIILTVDIRINTIESALSEWVVTTYSNEDINCSGNKYKFESLFTTIEVYANYVEEGNSEPTEFIVATCSFPTYSGNQKAIDFSSNIDKYNIQFSQLIAEPNIKYLKTELILKTWLDFQMDRICTDDLWLHSLPSTPDIDERVYQPIEPTPTLTIDGKQFAFESNNFKNEFYYREVIAP